MSTMEMSEREGEPAHRVLLGAIVVIRIRGRIALSGCSSVCPSSDICHCEWQQIGGHFRGEEGEGKELQWRCHCS